MVRDWREWLERMLSGVRYADDVLFEMFEGAAKGLKLCAEAVESRRRLGEHQQKPIPQEDKQIVEWLNEGTRLVAEAKNAQVNAERFLRGVGK